MSYNTAIQAPNQIIINPNVLDHFFQKGLNNLITNTAGLRMQLLQCGLAQHATLDPMVRKLNLFSDFDPLCKMIFIEFADQFFIEGKAVLEKCLNMSIPLKIAVLQVGLNAELIEQAQIAASRSLAITEVRSPEATAKRKPPTDDEISSPHRQKRIKTTSSNLEASLPMPGTPSASQTSSSSPMPLATPAPAKAVLPLPMPGTLSPFQISSSSPKLPATPALSEAVLPPSEAVSPQLPSVPTSPNALLFSEEELRIYGLVD